MKKGPRGFGSADLFYVRPAWAPTWRWKSSPEQVTAREGKRKGGRVTDRLKEAWNEAVG